MMSPLVRIGIRTDGQKGLFAAAPIAGTEELLTYDGPMLDHATRYSIQIDTNQHIDGTESSNAYLNHSCSPNAYVDWNERCLRALRPIRAGEEITCNYLTTDDEMHDPFVCKCGSPHCYGEIRGFRYLSRDQKRKLLPFLSPYLRAKVH